jgi:toxin ParE1/3/4
MKIVLLPAARKDIADIWSYGAREWSRDQANTYARRLMAVIDALAENPERCPRADWVTPGYRRLLAGSHAVFYRVDGDVVKVVRVLHQSRDAGGVVG